MINYLQDRGFFYSHETQFAIIFWNQTWNTHNELFLIDHQTLEPKKTFKETELARWVFEKLKAEEKLVNQQSNNEW